MSIARSLIAEIPLKHRDDVRWLVLEHDPDSHGWFLFGHQALAEPAAFDYWLVTRDEALTLAEEQWGVRPADWIAAPDALPDRP